MKIALAQLNYFIGDFPGNLAKMEDAFRKAVREGADLVVFSELSICGYPPLDLLERKEFITRCIEYVEQLARITGPHTGILVGGPEFNPHKEGKLLYNSAYFLQNGTSNRDRLLKDLDRIELEVRRIKVPLSFAGQLYHLRQHIDLIRIKLLES